MKESTKYGLVSGVVGITAVGILLGFPLLIPVKTIKIHIADDSSLSIYDLPMPSDSIARLIIQHYSQPGVTVLELEREEGAPIARIKEVENWSSEAGVRTDEVR